MAAQLMQGVMMLAQSLSGQVPPTTPLRLFAPPAPRTRNMLAITDGPVSPDASLVGDAAAHSPPPMMSQAAIASPPPSKDTKTSHDLLELPKEAIPSGILTVPSQVEIFAAARAARTEQRESEKAMKRPAAAGDMPKKKAKKAGDASGVPKMPQKKAVGDSGVPDMPKKQGEPAAHYNGGKILRSDSLQAWRVFLKSSDKPDKKVKFDGNPGKAWIAAMRMIDEYVASQSQ